MALDLARGTKAKQWSYLSYNEAYSSPIPLLIRLCKKSKQIIPKQKLAENFSHHVDFWKELKKINPITKCTTEVMDQVNGNANITELLVKQYKTLYNSVKTSENEYCELNGAFTCI